ncbi:MAG: 5-oxoprolinase [Deltaproteobacteria bacterium]|nr:MAG: 5-oxoprolinase [Deltaproteobacteria bacterium]
MAGEGASRRRPRWSFWIDRGGTFTDVVGFSPDQGILRATKVLSSDEAPLVGIRRILGISPDRALPACEVRLGTTVATNALLEGRPCDAAMVVTRGFSDILRIGDQRRPDLFALSFRPRPVLPRRIVEVPDRTSADGAVLAEHDADALAAHLAAIRSAGIESLGVCLVHAARAPQLESAIADLARRVGFRHVVSSHEIAGAPGLVRRMATTAVDAAVTPLLRDYLDGLVRALGNAPLLVMQSSGGLAEAHRVRAAQTVLSGPAGGVVAAATIARQAGFDRAVSLDVGGTSTDVARVLPEPALHESVDVGGHEVFVPAVDVHTVAAGGGSICRFEDGRLEVGPQSAGADPGPLAYGRPEAVHPTLTDALVVLGRVVGDRFPFPLDTERPLTAFSDLADRAGLDRPEAAAEGCLEVAVARVADAIRTVTAARGFDPRHHALVVFGGAGGQLAGPVARALGVSTVLLDPLAGVLSALGIGLARREHHGRRALFDVPLDAASCRAMTRAFEDLRSEAARATGVAVAEDAPRTALLRYAGTETDVEVTVRGDPTPAALHAAFEAAHRHAFGYVRPGHPILVHAVRLVHRYGPPPPPRPTLPPAEGPPEPVRTARVWLDGASREVPVLRREDLRPGHVLEGPCLVLEDTGTIFVDPGFELRIEATGLARLTHTERAEGRERVAADAVLRSIVAGRLTSIAERMGRILAATAISTNIRERHDFSCAIFDADGRLVANAPHVPVHLGAMGETVRVVAERCPDAADGDAFATNDPALGGTHLPDVTVVRPVFVDGRLRFYVAARGHHADIGGRTPGSMPPDATTLEEEGVVLPLLRIARGGVLDEAAVRRALTEAPHPARDPATNAADLAAQLAACHAGATDLGALCRELGTDTVAAQMAAIHREGADAVRQAIATWSRDAAVFEDALDDGTPLVVRVVRHGERLRVDFAGTGGPHPGNRNAPRAITVAALLYALRVWAARPIPLCAGTLAPIEVRIPSGSLLDPPPGRAVAAGNVETAQRIVDVLLGALGLCAASQGTMNNLTFGDERRGYYETIAGGTGAGPGFDGASGVHSHMTNTKITDPEILEATWPVRVHRFGLRHEPGGDGRYRGGRGLWREIEFLAPLHVAVTSERRTLAPFGLAGGGAGPRGVNQLDGRAVPGSFSARVDAGTRLAILTPGGGGYGRGDGPWGDGRRTQTSSRPMRTDGSRR